MSDPELGLKKARLSFGTYISLAGRNLVRNSRRTALTLMALIVAMGALTYLMGFINGYASSMRENFALAMNGHIQICSLKFRETSLIDDHISNSLPIAEFLDNDPRVRGWTQRISTSGLVSVARATTSVAIVGVDQVHEADVSRLKNFVLQGDWLDQEDDRGVLLGKDVAENLGVELGDKVVLMTQGPGGHIVSESFRVRGLLVSGIPDIDRTLALVGLTQMQSWLGIGDGITEVVVRTHSFDDVDPLANSLVAQFGESQDIQPWYTQNPLLEQMLEFQDAARFIMIGLVVALVLGQLVNTMFMSLYDRVREFGLMEALGSQRLNLFTMLICESIILVFMGGAIGYLLAYVAVFFSARIGIDLTSMGDTLGTMYMDPVIRPSVDLRSTIFVFGTIVVTALLAGLLPAWRATRLNPIEAMRQI